MKVLKLFLIVGIVAFGLGIVVIWQAQSVNLPWIAFDHYFQGSNEIYVIRADGSEQRKLTNHPAGVKAHDREPAWSPDGKWIAFASDRGHNFFAYDIYLIDPNGGNPKLLTDHPASGSEPAWSPDGKHLAFNSTIDDNVEIYIMDISGKKPKNLTNHPGLDASPAWSPDGNRIAFVSNRQGNNKDIYIMDLKSGKIQAIAPHPAEDSHPSWSPDGKKLTFDSNRAGPYDIYLFDLEIKELKNLTPKPRGIDEGPSFSPDGKEIAFSSNRASAEAPQMELRQAIYVMNLDGNNIRRVTSNPRSFDKNPSWFDPSIPITSFRVDWLGKLISTWGEIKRK